MKEICAAVALLITVAAHAQDSPASAPAESYAAYHAAEDCMRAYGRRFAATQALPQDVADAALEACFQKRWEAAAAKARRGGMSDARANTQPDESSLRRVAIMALLEARYPKR